jgi:integrase
MATTMTDAGSVALMFRLHPRSAWTPTKHPALRLLGGRRAPALLLGWEVRWGEGTSHTLRRTIAGLIGNLRAVQLLLGHTKLESTVRYLGIEVDDALRISEQIDL